MARSKTCTGPGRSHATARIAPHHPDAPQLPNPATPRARDAETRPIPSYALSARHASAASFKKSAVSIDVVFMASCASEAVGVLSLKASPSKVGDGL